VVSWLSAPSLIKKGIKMFKKLENAVYTLKIIMKNRERVEDLINRILHDIQNDLDSDYGNGKSFDVDSWETENDSEIISYDIGYMNAMKYVLQIMRGEK
tara:strand:+ start:728 stop:1024 length:297 start_codon:yes stop_codon:yes gene_type:complete